jgi:hypothetical protein
VIENYPHLVENKHHRNGEEVERQRMKSRMSREKKQAISGEHKEITRKVNFSSKIPLEMHIQEEFPCL